MHTRTFFIIEAVFQACFRLVVALAITAIVAGAFLALALAGAHGPSAPMSDPGFPGEVNGIDRIVD